MYLIVLPLCCVVCLLLCWLLANGIEVCSVVLDCLFVLCAVVLVMLLGFVLANCFCWVGGYAVL